MKQKVSRRQNLLDIMLVLFAKTISRLSENSVTKCACCRKELTTVVFFVSIVLSSTSLLQFFFCILLSNNTLFLTPHPKESVFEIASLQSFFYSTRVKASLFSCCL